MLVLHVCSFHHFLHLKILTNIEQEIIKYLGVKNKIRPEEYENILGSKKGNFDKMKLSQREIGQSNYEKIISCYKNDIVLKKNA